MQEIIFSDRNLFDKKRGNIIDMGLESLHFIADFDLTLTKNVEGEKNFTTWEVFSLNDDYVKERDRLVSIYKPIEYDPSVPLEIKSKKMDEWWALHLGEIMKHGLTRSLIVDGVKNSKISPRGGFVKFFQYMNKNDIPCLIFSAGLGDVIAEFLLQKEVLDKNIHIVSNFFIFDKDGIPSGFIDDIVHSFNKSEKHIRGKPYLKEISEKKNVILLGDSLGDGTMSDGLTHENIIRIGFLNGNVDKLEAYKKIYDVVITGDGGLDFVVDSLIGIKK